MFWNRLMALGAVSLFLSLPAVVLADDPAPQAAAKAFGAGLPLLDPAAFDRPAAAHLLWRAGFAPTPEEIDRCTALGIEKAVDRLLEIAGPDLLPFNFHKIERPSRAELAKLDKRTQQKKMQEIQRQENQEFQRLRGWWIRRMVATPQPLEEKMTLFWHGHFTSSQRDVKNGYHMYLQNQLLRSHALGNFKELVRAVAKDPAMLRYLDNNRNVRRSPNENFARELMELFTLGIGNYTEKDIKEAARALTGWTFRGDEFTFRAESHDPGEKTLLGRTGKLTGDDVVDVIFEQPAASRFLPRKLLVFFAYEEPPEEVVEALAATFRESGFEIRPVLRQLFRSAEFYSSRSRGSQVKSPVQLVAGTLRLLELDPGEAPAPAGIAGQLGQDLLLPPNVKGWEGGKSWISTSTLFDRYNFTGALLGLEGRERPQPGKKEKEPEAAPRPDGRRVPRFDPQSGAKRILGEGWESWKPEQVVDAVLRRFLAVPMAEEGRKKLVAFYEKADSRNRLAELIHLTLSSPEYQLN